VPNRTSHERLTDELREQLSLYSLELLDDAEASVVESHLAEGCAVCAEEVAHIRTAVSVLAAEAPRVQPPDTLRDRILAGIRRKDQPRQAWKEWTEPDPGDLHVVRQNEGAWELVAPGVSARRLYVDRARDAVTMMIRMEPGAKWIPHRHAGPEQCFVVEGDLYDGESTFYAGDFQCAPPGSVHGAQSTENGCLLLIVSSLHDQLLA
jgi:anti-sigma factor ChrR (cupin superfamily)